MMHGCGVSMTHGCGISMTHGSGVSMVHGCYFSYIYIHTYMHVTTAQIRVHVPVLI